ncbi:MAG TPA: FAD-dependent oxidoreductase [Steroidobacteraceae bacterium]|nr:FAD-dependent oxidoreductase [Steroidobacteraceae bacterium]
MKSEHRIVVAGGGYAGVSCALRLARRVPSKVSVTLISATDRFVERIRLHQRATGQDVGDWSLPALIRRSGVELRVGVIEQMDLSNRLFKLGGERVEFDTAVLALGSYVDVHSIKGVREHAMAVEFGAVSGIHQALRKAAAHRARIAIVGGGLTGIELATEVAEVFPDLQVSIVSQTPLAESWSAAAREHVLAAMERFGIRVEEGLHIRAVHRKHLETDRGDLPFDLCIWAGGFVGHSLAWNSGLKVNGQGQALVDTQLRSVSHPGVHVVGDLAAIAPELTPQMPMGCKSAMPAGAWAAENIARRLSGQPEQSLQYAVPFFCVSLGRRDGLIQMAAPDGSMTGRVLTHRRGAWFKEFICRSTMWALKMERLGISGIQWVKSRPASEIEAPQAS